MNEQTKNYTELPINMVGSTKFGRFPKMSTEETFNMIISDDWLVPFGGYRNVQMISAAGQGRSAIPSIKANKMFLVIDDDLYMLDSSLTRTKVGSLATFSGDVSMAESNSDEIGISDNENIYIYNYATDVFTTLTPAVGELGFKPGFLTFKDGSFIAPDINNNFWHLSQSGTGLVWPADAQHIGEISTKATRCLACVNPPSEGNLILVLGSNVTELWTNVGAQLFPYQRNQSVNLDYGVINPASIDSLQDTVCWIGINEKAGPAIMAVRGDKIEKISTDGIDYVLSNLKFPQFCYGYMLRLAGHVCYVATWTKDNLSYLYDFNTESFFTLCDENRDAFIIKKVILFQDRYYFVSIRDGNLYELSDNFYTYDYGDGDIYEIPQIRVPKAVRMLDQSRFIAGYFGFTVEQGHLPYQINETDNLPRIDFSISRDGGVTWGNNQSKRMNALGRRVSRVQFRCLGSSNDLTPQIRFNGFGRFVCSDGYMGVYQ